MESPLVSILIPNYNKSQFLKETLDSVLSQTYTNWECIIVDDHSTDNSWEILEEYASKDSRFRLFKRPDNRKQGGNAARNYAFELSLGEYINWFDSDDIMDSNMLKNKISVISMFNADIVLGDLIENEYSYLKKFKSNLPNYNYENFSIGYLIGDLWFGTPQPMFKRTFLFRYSRLFNEKILKGQESEFFIFLLLFNPSIKLAIDSVSIYRNNSLSIPYSRKLTRDVFYKVEVVKNFKRTNNLNKESFVIFKNIFFENIEYVDFLSREYFLNFSMVKYIYYYFNFKDYIYIFKVFLYRFVNLKFYFKN